MGNGEPDTSLSAPRGRRKPSCPRFVLLGPNARAVGERLALLGWRPLAVAVDPADTDRDTLASAEVLVFACTGRLFLSPEFQESAGNLGAGLPCVAVITPGDTDAAAYAARLGWSGYVSADSAPAALAGAIAAAAGGELSFPASATQALVRALARVAPVRSVSSQSLTPRQRQIVDLIAEGATDGEVASMLGISSSTARKHVQNARRKLRARTRSQLVAASHGVSLELAPVGAPPR